MRHHFIKLLFADLRGRRIAERVITSLADALAPVIDNRHEGALTGAVADKSFGAAQLRVVGVDGYLAELLGTVGEKRRGRLIGHLLRKLSRQRSKNGGVRLLFPVALQTKRGKLTPL